jgi:hypothetical protein
VSTLYTSLAAAETKSTTIATTFSTNDEAVRTNSTSLPIKAAQLSSLLISLTEVEAAVSGSIQARQALIAGLERLVADNKASLKKEESQAAALKSRRAAIISEKDHVEQMIVRGSAPTATDGFEPPRPDAEPLTPPPVESITPVGSPNGQNDFEDESEPVLPILTTKHTSDTNGHEQPSAKKRKLAQVDDSSALDLGNVDPEVEALLAGN